MRDPKRIQRILGLLEHVWNRDQDQRLCQLICNITEHHRDLFYVEDDEVEAGLNQFLNEGTWHAFTPAQGKDA